jgi:glycosyltransferase involved in cell wall biosynthesis
MLYPTSYGEGMPICLLEGMGMGLVVVTRPVAGIRDIVVDGENGFLIESLDPKAFAERLQYLVQNVAVCRRLIHKSQREAEARFEVKNVAKRMEEIYFETGQWP